MPGKCCGFSISFPGEREREREAGERKKDLKIESKRDRGMAI